MDVSLLALAVLTIVNGYWTWQSRKIQNDRDIIRSQQLALDAKDEALKEMVRSKNVLKHQFETQLVLTKKLEGQVETYHKFHGHKPLA